MSKEQEISQQVVELSPSLLRLQTLHEKLFNTQRSLFTTFFKDDTWLVRQAGTYGIPLLSAEGDEEPDWQKEEAFVEKIFEELRGRASYFEAAYHFPDVLSAFCVQTSKSWTEMIAQQENITPDEAADSTFEGIQNRLRDESTNLESFFTSPQFTQAFSIKIDKEKEAYQIDDLPLDPEELRAQWQELVIQQ